MALDSALDAAYGLISRSRYDEAARMLQEILAAGPSAKANYALGYIAFERNDLASAAAYFKTVLSLDNADANAAFYLGRVAEKSGDATMAHAYFAMALHIDPTHKSARERLGPHAWQPAAAHAAAATAPGYGHNPAATPPVSSPLPKGAGPAAPGGTVSPLTPGDASAGFYRLLLNDPSPSAKEATSMIDRLNMDVRPRLAPHILPVLFLGTILAAIVWIAFTIRAQNLPPTPMAEQTRIEIAQGHVSAANLPGARGLIAQEEYFQRLGASRMRLAAVAAAAGFTLLMLILTILRVRFTHIVFSDGRIKITRGILDRRVKNFELYRIVDLDLRQKVLPRLTGDAMLVLHVEHGGKTEKPLRILGLAKYKDLCRIFEDLRSAVLILRSGNWGKGIIY